MKLTSLLVGSLLLVSGTASAQEVGTVPLHFSADTAGAELEVSAGRHAPTMKCTAPCTLWVWPGDYRVKMRGPGIPSTSKKVGVLGPTRIDGEGGDSGSRITGLVLGSVGAGAVVIGFAGLLLSGPCSFGDCGSHKQDDSNKTPWLVTMGVGAVASGIGWVIFGSNGSSLSVATSPRISVVPTREGGALSLSGSF